MKETKQSVICIIGMHRSGTSMVARLLNICGLHLGSSTQLLGADRGNPLGHFEHGGFLRVNEALLAHFGGATDDPPVLRPGWEHDPSLRTIVDEAKSILETFSGRFPWGWKDPRTTILLPFWKSLIPNLRFVICVRSPLEVAKSLVEREGMSIEKSGYLWNLYMYASVQGTEGHPRIFTFYEDYFKTGSPEIDRVLAFCGLKKAGDSFELRDAVIRDLRHHTTDTEELLNEPDIATECKLFYIGLRGLSREQFMPTLSPDGAEAGDISDQIGSLSRVMNAFHNQERLGKLETALAAKDQQLHRLRSRIQEEMKSMAQLKQDNLDLQAFANAVRRTLAYRLYRTLFKPFRSN